MKVRGGGRIKRETDKRERERERESDRMKQRKTWRMRESEVNIM